LDGDSSGISRTVARKEAPDALATLSDFWIELFEVVGSVLEVDRPMICPLGL
jgi:hypothetical protein